MSLVDEDVRCVTRWERRIGLGHPHRCIREMGHEGRHWCSCGADMAWPPDEVDEATS